MQVLNEAPLCTYVMTTWNSERGGPPWTGGGEQQPAMLEDGRA